MNRLAIRRAPVTTGVCEMPRRVESRGNKCLKAGGGRVTTKEVVCELSLEQKTGVAQMDKLAEGTIISPVLDK